MTESAISTKRALAICLILTAIINAWVFKDFLLLRMLYVFLDVGSDSLAVGLPHIVAISNFLQNGTFPLWLHGIGIGQSTLSLNHTLFDPFNWLIFYFPQSAIPFLIGYLIWLKSLVASIVFFILCRTLKYSTFTSILGGLIYSLNGYIVLWGQHYVFGLAVIYFPLLLLGVEFWLSNRKPWLFLVTLFFSGIWSYYFLYMMTLFLAPYALYRIFYYEQNVRNNIKTILETTGLYLLGLGLASFVFLPSLMVALDGPRIGGQVAAFTFFASPEYYLSLISRFFSNHLKVGNHHYYDWWNIYELPNIYSSLLTILLVPISLIYWPSKKRILLVISMISLLTAFLLPSFGLLANAFSYVSYRWTFATIPFLLLLALRGLDHVLEVTHFNRKLLLLTLFISTTIFVLSIAISPTIFSWSDISLNDLVEAILPVLLLLTFYTFLLLRISLKKASYLWKVTLVLLVTLELGIHASVDVNNRTLLGADAPKLKKGIFDSAKEAAYDLKSHNSDFFRIIKTTEQVSFNDPIYQDYFGVTSYTPLNSKGTLAFLNLMDVPSPNFNYTKIPPDRLLLNSFLGIRYHIFDNPNNAIDGYHYLGSASNLSIYENNYFLPIGLAFNEYMEIQDFKKLQGFEKDQALLKFAVLTENSPLKRTMNPAKFEPTKMATPYRLDFDPKVQFENMDIKINSFPTRLDFETTAYDPYIALNTKSSHSGILSLSFKLSTSQEVTGQIYWRKGPGVFQIDRATYFVAKKGTNEYKFDLGYVSSIDRIRIEISNKPGKFTIENFQASIQPISLLENSKADIENLRKQSLKLSFWSDSKFEGSVDMVKSGILIMQIPSAKGWTAYLDEKQTQIEQVNGGLIGIATPAGKHLISLRYTPPFLLIGTIISALCLTILLVLFSPKRLWPRKSN